MWFQFFCSLTMKKLLVPGRSLLQPGDVGIVGGRFHPFGFAVTSHWRTRVRVKPPMNFGMAVREIERPGAVVVTGRDVAKNGVLARLHEDREVAVVNAISPFVEKDECFGRRRIDHV